jgi:nucleoside-diphosphate-sugar epimerase
VNVEATLAMADECREAGVARWVHVSTALTYGPSSLPVEANGRLWTDAPGSYIRSRVECLLGVRERVAGGLPAVVVSPTIVYGPDAPRHPNRITSHLRRLLRTGLSVAVAGGRARRNLVYVDDVVDGLLLAEERAAVGQELVLGGEDVTPADLDALAWSLAGRRPRARLSLPGALARGAARALDLARGYHRDAGYAEAVATLAREWRFTSRAAERALGYRWRPVADGLRRTLDFVGGAERRP